MANDLRQVLLDQTDMVNAQVERALTGLTDDEFFWEPVPDCWTLRNRMEVPAERRSPRSLGTWVIEEEQPDPDPAPFTTIAWRVTHLSLSVWQYLEAFARDEAEREALPLPVPPGVAKESADWANEMLAHFRDTVATFDEGELHEHIPVWDSTASRAFVVGHVHREVVHHAAEVACLRDLYRLTIGPAGAWSHL
jgi:hypothetical protein